MLILVVYAAASAVGHQGKAGYTATISVVSQQRHHRTILCLHRYCQVLISFPIVNTVTLHCRGCSSRGRTESRVLICTRQSLGRFRMVLFSSALTAGSGEAEDMLQVAC